MIASILTNCKDKYGQLSGNAISKLVKLIIKLLKLTIPGLLSSIWVNHRCINNEIRLLDCIFASISQDWHRGVLHVLLSDIKR